MDRLEGLLESFYGLEDETSAVRNSHDIDSSAFSIPEAVSEAVATKPLPELLAYKENVLRQTKHLDHEMQQLVYNNYNRFIAATDTIRTMKASVGEMESRMDGLVNDMKKMGGSSELVNDSLQENRSKIEKLISVKKLLLKLEFLFELPLRLKRAIELDAQGQAVRYYCMVIGTLRKHDHIPSLHRIRMEADSIIHGLKEELRGVLRDANAAVAGGASKPSSLGVSSGRVVEAIKLLVQLDEPRAVLRSSFLGFQKARLLASLAAHANRYPSPTANNASSSSASSLSSPSGSALLSSTAQTYYSVALANRAGGSSPSHTGGADSSHSSGGGYRPRATVMPLLWTQQLDRSFVDAFKLAAEMYSELFIDPSAASSSSSSGGNASSSVQGRVAVTPEEKRAAQDELLAFAKEVFAEYFAAVKKQLCLPPPLPSELPGGAPSSSTSAGPLSPTRLTSAGALAGLRSPEQLPVQDEDLIAAEKAKASANAAAAAANANATSGQAVNRFDSLVDALKLFLSDVRSAARSVPSARLSDRATECTEAVLRSQLDGIFADVRVDVLKGLVGLHGYVGELVEGEKAKAVRAAAGLPLDGSSTAAGSAAAGAPEGAKSEAGAGASTSSSNPFASPAAAQRERRASSNPFGAAPTGGASATAPPIAAVPADSAPSGPRKAASSYDWLSAVGAGLSSRAEQCSSDVSVRIDAALEESRPLILNAMRLLPDLSKAFHSLVHGQVINLLFWLASAWEAQSDPRHPCRQEFAGIVVEADLALERETAVLAGSNGSSSGAGSGRRVRGGASSSVSSHMHSLKRRVAVAFAGAEAAADGAAAATTASSAGVAASGVAGHAAVERQQALLLLLACLCRHFAQSGVARALSTMLSTLPTRSDLATMGISPPNALEGPGGADDAMAGASGAGAGGDTAYGAMMDVPDIIRRTQQVGKELLRAYAKNEGLRLGAVIRMAMTSGGATMRKGAEASPKAARLFVTVLLEDIAVVKKLVGCTLGDFDARSSIAAALSYGIGAGALKQQQGAASASADEGSGAGASAASSGNPFGEGAASSSRLTATLGNPFAAPPPPASSRGASSSGAARDLSQGVQPGVLSAAQAARRTGVVVGAAGAIAGLQGTGSRGAVNAGSLQSATAGNPSGAGAAASSAASSTALDFERMFHSGAAAGSSVDGAPSGAGTGSGVPGIVLGLVDYSSTSVVRNLLRVLFKSLVEWARASTFSVEGFQQLQVDIATLHLAVPFFVGPPLPGSSHGYHGSGHADPYHYSSSGGGKHDPYQGCLPLEEVLGEAAVSGAERCLQAAVPLEMAVVHSLASEALQGINLSL